MMLDLIQEVRIRQRVFHDPVRFRVIIERHTEERPHGPVYWVLRKRIQEGSKQTKLYETEEWGWTENLAEAKKFREVHERFLCENVAYDLNQEARKNRKREKYCALPIFEDE